MNIMDLDAELAELTNELMLQPVPARLPRQPLRAVDAQPAAEARADDVIPPDPRGALDID
jgi:hypothetical protein